MRELDPLVRSYVHLDKLPRAKDALRSLQKIASLVKPIMRRRGWSVDTLAEFWPDQQNLLGLNVNCGKKICLRLRYASDKTQFLPLEHVVDTMLHELSHNKVGPHNEQFHQLWNELRDEYDDLKYKGYTGEGFLGDGQRLGGRGPPLQELRRHARQAAERSRAVKTNAGRKLGGTPVPRTADIRATIADAATRRQSITQGCASGRKNSEVIANEATRNGFRTQAEEDEANDRAIAEALWELAQEDSQAVGGGGVDSARQWESEGLSWNPETGLEPIQERDRIRSKSHVQPPPAADSGRHSPSPSLLPSTAYQPPAKKQKQDGSLLPSTTYRPPPPKSPSPTTRNGKKSTDTEKMPPPSAEDAPSAQLRQNPKSETMRPDSTTLGPTFTVPQGSPVRKKFVKTPPLRTQKSLPPLPPLPASGQAPPLANHPAFRKGSGARPEQLQNIDRRLQTNYQPSISSAASTNDNYNSPHPSAFDSPIAQHQSPRAPGIHSNNSSTSTASVVSPNTPTATRPPAITLPRNNHHPPTPPPSVKDSMWTCPVCTLSNPSSFLCCDACTTERPCHGSIDDWSTLTSLWPDAMPDPAYPDATPCSPAELPGSVPWAATLHDDDDDDDERGVRTSLGPTESSVSLPRSDSGRSSISAVSTASLRTAAALRTARSLAAATKGEVPAEARRLGWICRCGSFMEDKWWTCSACGRMKAVS